MNDLVQVQAIQIERGEMHDTPVRLARPDADDSVGESDEAGIVLGVAQDDAIVKLAVGIALVIKKAVRVASPICAPWKPPS